MLNIEKAGRTIKILGVAMFIQFSAILIIVKSYSAVLGNADIIAFIIFIGYSVLTYITGSKIKKNIISAKKTGIALCILSLINIPIGFILIFISL